MNNNNGPELRPLLRKVKQRLHKVSFPVVLSENRFIKRNTGTNICMKK
jgi:hypothetical protein